MGLVSLIYDTGAKGTRLPSFVSLWENLPMAVKDRFKGIPKAEQRGQRWVADYTNTSGRRVVERFSTKAEAETWHADRLREKRAGVSVDTRAAQRTTLAMLWPQFRERLVTGGARGGSPSSRKTMDNYDRAWKSYIEPRWGTAPLAAIKHEQVIEWIDTMAAVSGGPASQATRQEVGKKFITLLDHAVRKFYLTQNPAKDALQRSDYLPRPKKTKDHIYLTMAQLNSLAEHCTDYEDLILTAGLCGLRWGEVSALQVEDITLGDRPSMRICRAYTDVGGVLQLEGTKNGLERSVPLPRALADMLAQRIAERPPAARVWDAPKGGPIRNSSFVQKGRFVKAKAAAAAAATSAKLPAFPDLTFHDLRHTAVSLHISLGSNVKVVQQIAGHADATLTLNTYAGLFDHDRHDSAARVDAAFSKIRKSS